MSRPEIIVQSGRQRLASGEPVERETRTEGPRNNKGKLDEDEEEEEQEEEELELEELQEGGVEFTCLVREGESTDLTRGFRSAAAGPPRLEHF